MRYALHPPMGRSLALGEAEWNAACALNRDPAWPPLRVIGAMLCAMDAGLADRPDAQEWRLAVWRERHGAHGIPEGAAAA